MTNDPLQILRLERVARWADARLKRAIELGNTDRAFRAAHLVTVLEKRMSAIAMAAVRPYSDTLNRP